MTRIGSKQSTGVLGVFLAGLGLVVLLWLLESVLHAFVFHDASFMDSLLRPPSHELWMRLVVSCMAILVGVFACKLLTERRKAQASLSVSQERFAQVAENLREWLWEVDTDGLYTYASPVVESILGYTPEEIVGKEHFYDLFHEDDRAALKEAALEAFAEKKPFRGLVNRNYHKNGQTIVLSTSGVPVLDENGELIAYRGADIDITAEIATQGELLVFRKFAEASNEGMGWAALSGKIVYANPILCKFLDAERAEDILGTNVIDYYRKIDRDRVAKDILLTVLNEGRWTGEVTLVSTQGRETSTKQSIFLIRSDDGEPAYFANVLTEISESK